MIHNHSFEVGGKTFFLESGRVAKQAGGSVLLGMGQTVILGTATMSRSAREGIDFLPLVCDFEERKYAIGKIPGGFLKRGGRPSDKAVLISRLIDRPLRPLFPKGTRNDIQVITMAFSVDKQVPPDVLAINAAGAALAVSDVPFNGPVAGVRVGCIDKELVLFPSNEELKSSTLDLVVAGHKGAISMVEAASFEVSEDLMIRALNFAHEAIRAICAEFEAFAKIAGKPKRDPIVVLPPAELVEEIKKNEASFIESGLFDPDKAKRESAMDDVVRELTAKYKLIHADSPETLKVLGEAVDKAVKGTLRRFILDEDRRPDGRSSTEIRSLEAAAGLLPRVHGSGLFTRGQTQVMTVLTLGLPKEAQMMDTLDEEEEDKRYMHFYNFPPYSVGEVRMLRGAGRREVGHGALAEKALRPVVPIDDPEFPYTLHLVSEVLESNGSTSMASVCGSTLALMDGGVKIKAPVAGIAMGLISDGVKFRVLTDIQGVEDFSGDMDFKVAGTREGITALQLDTKLEGIPEEVLADALRQARDARFQILDVIEAEIAAPRLDLAASAPRVTIVRINPEKIGALIGPGGATIRKITETTGTEIEVQQDGRVLVAATDGPSAAEAISMIKSLTMEMTVGLEFEGAVTRLFGRGAMVEMPGGREGLVPTEKLTHRKVSRPDDVVAVGDRIKVKVDEVDSMGRVNLSALDLNPDNDKLSGDAPFNPPSPGGGGRDFRDRGGDRGGRGGYGDRGRDRGGDRGPRDSGPRDGGNRDGGPRDGGGPRDSGPRDGGGDKDINPKFRPRR
jgi:polyribonucleotide nucleotidyltransferase